ncbi:MAG: DUF1552 domain-containing protein [Opitutae bacterium]|nr:DUF1552 domain-containing protein [Opitutae bacterium]
MKLSRRQFISTSGATLVLPFLPSLSGASAKALLPNKKLVMMYIPNGILRRYFFPGEEEAVLPGFVGGFNADKMKDAKRILNEPGIYPLEFTSTMKPLLKHKDDITMVTGLDRTFKNGQDVHAQGASCYLTSVSPEQAAVKGMRHPNGRSLDQIIGDNVGHTSVYNTLEISCNGFTGGKEDIFFDNISWYGPGKIAPSIKNPRKLYDRLFMADSYRNHVQDVTDLILADTKSIARKIGNQDKDTLDGFVTMIREIELRIEKLEKMISGANVNQPTNEILPRGEYIRLQADLMLAALQMGITNVSTFMIGPERWDASLMYEGVFPKPVQHHNMTHNQKKEEVAKELQKIDIFHLEQLSYVITRMKEIKESDGTSLFENSLLTYGAGLGDGATHQFFDLPMIVAGKGQGQIKQGRFIKCKSGTLNSNLWLTLANLMGLEIESFADSNAVISDLWT